MRFKCRAQVVEQYLWEKEYTYAPYEIPLVLGVLVQIFNVRLASLAPVWSV